MVNIARGSLSDARSLRAALKVLSSEDLLQLNEEIEQIALERMAEEEVRSKRERKIEEFKIMLALEGIEPEELIAFIRGTVSGSKRGK